jgi:hypothetical protein
MFLVVGVNFANVARAASVRLPSPNTNMRDRMQTKPAVSRVNSGIFLFTPQNSTPHSTRSTKGSTRCGLQLHRGWRGQAIHGGTRHFLSLDAFEKDLHDQPIQFVL